MSNILDVNVEELPELVKYFEQLMGVGRVKMIANDGAKSLRPPFWYKYIKAFRKWSRNGQRTETVTSNETLMRFGMLVHSMKVFQDDWDIDGKRKEFIRRLRKSDEVESLLFELGSGVHFKLQGLETHWVSNENDFAVPDILIKSKTGKTVSVECTLKKSSKVREHSDQKLIDDLVKGAKEKLQSSRIWETPRIIVIGVPEFVDWNNKMLKASILFSFEKWKEDDRLNNVSAAVFMGDHKLIRISKPELNQLIIQPDKDVFHVPNPYAQIQLPEDIQAKIVIRIPK